MLNKSSLKQIGLTTLRKAGAFSVIANSERRRRRLLILCYHGISLTDEHHWIPHLYMSPERFRQRMKTLASFHVNVLPLGEALLRMRNADLPPRSVAITFDDGFYDFRRHALPILQQFGYPCTIYLTTHYCNYRMPIFNLVVNYLLWRSGRTLFELPQFGVGRPLGARGYHDRQIVVKQVLDWAEQQELDTASKNDAARALAAELGVDYSSIEQNRLLQIMSPEEVSDVAAQGFDIQLHTHRHRTPRQRDLLLREVTDNRSRIYELTGVNPVHFCYPSGDYDPVCFPWLLEAGIESATTCNMGLAARASDPLMLPRVLDDTTVQQLDFESWLCGVRLN